MKRTLGRLISIMMTVAMITSSAAMPAYAATEKDPDIAVESSVTESEVSESTEGEGVSFETDETEALGEETAETSEISSDDTEAADESDETGDSEEEMTEGTDESEAADETSVIEEAEDEVEMVGDESIPAGMVISGNKILKYTGTADVVTIPDNIETIGEEAFSGSTVGYVICTKNSKLKTIEKKAFKGCTKLSKIDLPYSLQYIGDEAFKDCIHLNTGVWFPDGLKKIGDYAFKNTDISVINLPKDLESIGKGAFSGCIKLESVDLYCENLKSVGHSDPESIGFEPGDFCFYGSDIKWLVIGSDVTSIPSYLFCYAGIRYRKEYNYYFGDNIESIGDYAFAYTNMSSPRFGYMDSMDIGKGAFKGCSNITSVELPSCACVIGDYAFAETGLTDITLPEDLMTLGKGVFKDCKDLATVTVNTVELQGVGYETKGTATGLDLDFVPSQSCFYGCNITDIEFGDDVTRIPAYMFCYAGFAANTAVEIPGNIKTIDKYAFAYTDIGTPVFNGDGDLYIREGAFKNCTNMTAIDLPSGVKDIGDYAFAKSGLQSITLPRDLATIGMGAFNSCNKLAAVKVNSTNIQSVGCTTEGSGTETFFVFYSCCFGGCKITDLKFDEDVTQIPAYLFCYADISEGYEVKLPTKTSKIGKAAFANTKIGKVECGSGHTEIGELAFLNCNKLTDIYISSKTGTIDDNAFYNVSSGFTVHAPGGSFAISWAYEKGINSEAVGTYKITYHLDGGEPSAANPDVYMTGHGISKFAEPTKTGYTFEGWFGDIALTEPRNGISSAETGDVEVYAKWRVNTYTIEFDKNAYEAAGDVKNKQLSYDESVKLSDTDIYTRPRFSQTAWNTKADGTGTEYKLDATVKNLTDKDKGKVKLYAVWSPSNEYIITYDLNAEVVGGKVTGSVRNQTYHYGEAVTIPATDLRAAGYKFLGWAFSASASKADFAPKTELIVGSEGMNNLTSRAEKNNAVTLYAVWDTIVEYTIKVYAEPKKLVDEDTECEPFENVKYGEAVDISGLFTKTDYTLVSYKNDKNKTVAPGEVRNLTTVDKSTVNLYAQWKATAYGITYADSMEGTGAVMKNKNKAKSFTAGTKTITLKAPTKEGYKFAGWTVSAVPGDHFLDNEGDIVTAVEKGIYHQPIVLTAAWTAQDITYKIKVQGEGYLLDKTDVLAGEMVNKNPVTFANTRNITLKKPSITGYTFMGWYDDADCKVKNGKISKSTTESSEAITKYALFAENTYTLVIKANNKNKNEAVYENLKFSDDITLERMARTDDQSWKYDEGRDAQIRFFSTKANGKGTNYGPVASISGLSSKNKSTVTLYAIWDTYRITYIDDEAELSSSKMKNSSSNPVIYTASTVPKSRYIKLKNPTKTGYAFKSWECDKEGAVTTDDKGRFEIDRGMNGPVNIVVRARWTANTYNIYLYPNAKDAELVKGTDKVKVSNSKSAGKCACVTATYDGKEFEYDGTHLKTLDDIKYERPGYIFKGWNTKANGKGKAYNSKEALNLKSKKGASTILYAIWVKAAPSRVTGVHIANQRILYFDKQAGVDGYEYQMAENITSVYGQKTRTTTRLSRSDNGKQYIRVRAYRIDSTGNNVYGPWSFVKCITINISSMG